jgi:alkane 1-monooxygenase
MDAPRGNRTIHLRPLRYLITYTAPVLAFVGFHQGGPWSWALILYAFLLIPLAELLIPEDHSNLSQAGEEQAAKDRWFDLILYSLLPIHWGLLLYFLVRVGDPLLQGWEIAGMVMSMGVLCGIYGINVAHELGHRSTRWERTMARAMLLSSQYMHFIIEHNRGHHSRVGTHADPASARFGESIYRFWPRTVFHSWLSAWELEQDRLRRESSSPWSIRNEMVQAMLLQGLLLAAILFLAGPAVLVFYLAAALVGILLLETVNYIEHYGLGRRPNEKGGHGRVLHVHSWNSDHLLGRLMLFELTRHSDHHWRASRKYQVLRSEERSPQLPTGYPGMMLLSLLPPLFFRVMHPRIHRIITEHAEVVPAR